VFAKYLHPEFLLLNIYFDKSCNEALARRQCCVLFQSKDLAGRVRHAGCI